MHPFLLFPSLLAYEQIAPFIIRVVLGFTLLYFGLRKMRGEGQSSGSNSYRYGLIEVIIAIFLIVGLYTQLAALINAIILIFKIGFKINEKKFLTDGVNYYVLLLAMAIALLFMGPGVLSFDLIL